MSEMTRSWAATAASSAAALFTSKETAVVLGRSAARASAEVSVRQAICDSATKTARENDVTHTNGELVGWVTDDVLGARACNKSATKEKDLLLGLDLEELRLTTEDGPDIFALDQQAAREFGQVEGRRMQGFVVVSRILDPRERESSSRVRGPWRRP